MLNPGPETDLRIAQTCGFKADIADGNCWVEEQPFRNCHRFRPSIDLNDAFLAAEKCKLFWHHPRRVLSFAGEVAGEQEWEIYTVGDYDCQDLTADGSTPALAICAAILALKEQS